MTSPTRPYRLSANRRLIDSRHHYGGPFGNPCCLVIDRNDPESCPGDGIYWVTAEDQRRGTRYSFGSCVEHTVQVRTEPLAFTLVSITTDHPYREAL